MDPCCQVGITAAAVEVSRQDRGRERDGRHEHQQQQVDEHRRPVDVREAVQHAVVVDQMIPITKKLTK
jgi:hypothetical protein